LKARGDSAANTAALNKTGNILMRFSAFGRRAPDGISGFAFAAPRIAARNNY
jgi:hypothetical protein